MNVVFEIDRSDTDTIEEIKSSVGHIEQEYITNGLNGTEIIAIVVALIPPIKDIILHYLPRKTVTIKISSEHGSVEISTNAIEEAEKMLDEYLRYNEGSHKK